MPKQKKHDNQTRAKRERPAGLRMRQLVEKSGLAKSTILLYVKEGLLPPPRKTAPNMAYYSPDTPDRLALIKRLQEDHHMPLRKIRQILEHGGGSPAVGALAELLATVFGQADGPTIGLAELCKKSGLDRSRVKKLSELRLLLPVEPGRFDQQDLAMASLMAEGMARGMDPDDLSFYPELGQKIVDREMRLRAKHTAHLPEADDAEQTLAMVQAARLMRAYVIDRLFMLRIAGADGLKDERLQG